MGVKTIIAAATFGAVLAVGSGSAFAAESLYLQDGVAVSGYDPVAYFNAGEPTEGSDEFTATYDGATYRFANAENVATFEADPAKYAPEYGGFCAFGAAMGQKIPTDPTAWHIEDGKLYLNVSHKVQARFEEDVPGYIRGADNNWPIIVNYDSEALKSSTPDGVTVGPQ